MPPRQATKPRLDLELTPMGRIVSDHDNRVLRLEDQHVEIKEQLATVTANLSNLDDKVSDGFNRLQQQFFELGEKMSISSDQLNEVATKTAADLAAVATKTAGELAALALREALKDGAMAVRRRQLTWLFGILATVLSSALTAMLIRGIR